MTKKQKEELKEEFKKRWEFVYWGRNWDGSPNYLPDTAIVEIIDWWLSQIEQVIQEKDEETVKKIDDFFNDYYITLPSPIQKKRVAVNKEIFKKYII